MLHDTPHLDGSNIRPKESIFVPSLDGKRWVDSPSCSPTYSVIDRFTCLFYLMNSY
jgi:hypothetical protein